MCRHGGEHESRGDGENNRRNGLGRGQCCEWNGVDGGAADNRNNGSAWKGRRWRSERAVVRSMDNTHLWCFAALIGGPMQKRYKAASALGPYLYENPS